MLQRASNESITQEDEASRDWKCGLCNIGFADLLGHLQSRRHRQQQNWNDQTRQLIEARKTHPRPSYIVLEYDTGGHVWEQCTLCLKTATRPHLQSYSHKNKVEERQNRANLNGGDGDRHEDVSGGVATGNPLPPSVMPPPAFAVEQPRSPHQPSGTTRTDAATQRSD